MKKLSCIILILIFAFIAILPASADNTTVIAQEVIARTNLERQNKGLALLKTNDTLNSAAQVRARELAQSFSHSRPNGKSCFTVLDEYSVIYYAAGENIASTYGGAESAVKMWMNSTGHRENILSTDFTHIGVGVYKSGNTYYYAQLFVNINSSSNDYLVDPYTSSTTTTTANQSTSPKGDVNGDGKISIVDARAVLVDIASGNASEDAIAIADMNGDKKLTIVDARQLLVKIASGEV